MLGSIAEYDSGEIVIDNDEIEAADWFLLDSLPFTYINGYGTLKFE